jgi:hypothetical protein
MTSPDRRFSSLARISAVAAVLAVAFLTVPARALEVDIDRPGFDYKVFDIDDTSPNLCEQACRKDRKCRAWTYVTPDFSGPKTSQKPKPKCRLKSGAAEARTDACCFSGVKGDSEKIIKNKEVQSLLATLGYDPGPIDGKPGRQTAEAIRRFQSEHEYTPDGRIAAPLIKGLWGSWYSRLHEAEKAGSGTTPAPTSAPAPVPAPAITSAKPAAPAEDLSDLDSLD